MANFNQDFNQDSNVWPIWTGKNIIESSSSLKFSRQIDVNIAGEATKVVILMDLFQRAFISFSEETAILRRADGKTQCQICGK